MAILDNDPNVNFNGTNESYVSPFGGSFQQTDPIANSNWFSRTFDSNSFEAQNNAYQAQLNRRFQAEQAQEQRDWEEEMSNTAYTRAVADMRNAGLNPYLAYSNGSVVSASTPTGAMAGGSSASVNANGTSITNLVGSAFQLVGKLLSLKK